MAQIFSLKNSKFFSGLKKICAIVAPITTGVEQTARMSRLVSAFVVVRFSRVETHLNDRYKHTILRQCIRTLHS